MLIRHFVNQLIFLIDDESINCIAIGYLCP